MYDSHRRVPDWSDLEAVGGRMAAAERRRVPITKYIKGDLARLGGASWRRDGMYL